MEAKYWRIYCYMEVAGSDKVIAELQKQLDDWKKIAKRLVSVLKK
jgi:hypothetical protein